MANDLVCIACFFDGNLSIGVNNEPRYEGGIVRPLMVRRSSTVSDLLDEIYRITKIDPRWYRLKLVCNWPITDRRSVAVHIVDDGDLSNMFTLSEYQRSIELYVEKDLVTNTQVSEASGNYSRMHDFDNNSAGFISSSRVEHNWNENMTGEECPYNPPTNWNVDSVDVGAASLSFPGLGHHPSYSTYMQDPKFPVKLTNPSNIDWTQTNMGESSSMHVEENEAQMPTQENEGSESEDDLTLPKENIVHHAMQDNENVTTWIDNAVANNEYVEFEEPLPDDAEEDEWINASVTKNIDIRQMGGLGNRRDNIVFNKGDLYETKAKLMQAIKEWSIKQNYSFRPVKSNTTCYSVVCSLNKLVNPQTSDAPSMNCPWRIHAAVGKRTNGHFKIIKVGGDHTCNNPTLNTDHVHATSSFISNMIMPIMKTELDLTPSDIQDRMHNMFKIRISYNKAWRARMKSLSRIFGDWEQSYQTLPQYLRAIEESNPGTITKITTDYIENEIEQFTGVFWAFGPSIEGFKYCRPVLSIDGTHLYGKYAGCLLVATGVDANDGLFPLAFAVVSAETEQNWEWFFSCIYELIPSVHRHRTITFISDRKKGISKALRDGWPAKKHHRYCLRHIIANFKRDGHRGVELENFFWHAGCATDVLRYEALRTKLREKSEFADTWINNNLRGRLHKWALHKDGGRRFCIMTTNCFESFNGVLKGARALPIQALIAKTFYRLNKCFYKRRQDGKSWKSNFTPTIEEILRSRVELARGYHLTRFDQHKWQVVDSKGLSFTVILNGENCSCTCNVPMLQKIPCEHVIASTSRQEEYGPNVSYLSFCSLWYSMEKYQSTYSPSFHPVPDSRFWKEFDHPTILPPHNTSARDEH